MPITENPIVANAAKAAGGPTNLARALGIRHGAIRSWHEAGRIPAERVPAVERATGIPRHQLRPDLYDDPAHSVSSAFDAEQTPGNDAAPSSAAAHARNNVTADRAA